MPRFKVTNNGRTYVLVDNDFIDVRPTLFGKRVKKDRLGYDTPKSFEFPISAIQSIKWSEGWLLAGPSLTITCTEGNNDPWRTSKGQKPWKFKVGSDAEDRKRNRALVLAWTLHLALRQMRFHVLEGDLPAVAELMPTRGEEVRAKAAELMSKFGGWVSKQLNRAVDKFEKTR